MLYEDHCFSGCFACGMETGFRVYNADPLKEKERQGKLWLFSVGVFVVFVCFLGGGGGCGGVVVERKCWCHCFFVMLITIQWSTVNTKC